MTSLQLAIAGGLLIGGGVALLVLRLLPAPPQLASALERLSPERRDDTPTPASSADAPLPDRVGLALQRRTPVARWWQAPTVDLRLLRIPVHRYYGEKALFALLGLAFPPVLTFAAAWVNISLPWVFPAGGSIALAAVLFLLPNYNVRDNAQAAREQFNLALASYSDGIAMLRDLGRGGTQAMVDALKPGDSWVFERLSEEVRLASFRGQGPWDGFDELAKELALPELADLADIVRLNAETGAPISVQLRDRANSLRDAQLANEQAKAGAAGERMAIPTSMLALVFLALLATPAILRIIYQGRS